jgi:hypothetical protein
MHACLCIQDKGLTSSIVPAALLQSAINELTARAQLAVDEESFGGPSVSDLSVAPFKVIDSFSGSAFYALFGIFSCRFYHSFVS